MVGEEDFYASNRFDIVEIPDFVPKMANFTLELMDLMLQMTNFMLKMTICAAPRNRFDINKDGELQNTERQHLRKQLVNHTAH